MSQTLKFKAEKIRDVIDDRIVVGARPDFRPECLMIKFPKEPYSPMIIPSDRVNKFMMLVGA